MSLCTTWRWPWLLWFLQFWSLFEQIIPNREQWWKKHSFTSYYLLILLSTAAGEYGEKSIDLLYFWVAYKNAERG